jgi:hypothetical protein
MSLDITLKKRGWEELYKANITHNLNKMAEEAGIYQALWHPDEIGITRAKQLILPLQQAIASMMMSADYYRKFDSPNGWGTYDNFLPWLEKLLKACEEYPEARVEVDR